MTYRTLSLQCQCGRPSSRIREIGFTTDRQLIVHWRCTDCKKHVYALKSLNDCWQDCPSEEELEEREIGHPEAKLEPAAIEETDAEFLRALGVSLPDGEDSLLLPPLNQEREMHDESM